jgi:ABC-type bacteriocin/lantibiotic exporter with double-glycine peptidase domain
LKSSVTTLETSDKLERSHNGFVPKISIMNLTMIYPETNMSAVTDLTLEVEENSVVALVGASGAGKTTLADLILGVLEPSQGSIIISGNSPLECARKWPGAISYVPQNVSIINGTIRENVTLGYPSVDVEDEVVIECLTNASLWGFVESLPEGLHSQVGDGGSRLSGGQKQRLGIARALLTNPKLLVLDEATSALDGETEADITDAIYKLKGATTVIIIAHRLSTIVDADKVVYMEHGRIVAQGKFADVRSAAPNFDHQANLMGIK